MRATGRSIFPELLAVIRKGSRKENPKHSGKICDGKRAMEALKTNPVLRNEPLIVRNATGIKRSTICAISSTKVTI